MQDRLHDIAHRQGSVGSQGQFELPALEAQIPGDHVHGRAAPHAEIVAPW